MSKFDEPEPGAVSGAVAEPHKMFVGWNFVKQLAAILGLYAATFFLLDANASLACLVAATAFPVAFGGFALHGPSPVCFCGSCFQHVPMGAAMLAAIMFLHTGFRSMTTGLEKYLKGLEPAAFDAIASLAATLPLVFDYAAIDGPAALVPWVFAFVFAALSVLFALRKRTSLSGRNQVVPMEDDQALDDFEADHNVWNDLLQLLVHHAIAPFLVPALDDSSECSLALTCHFAMDVFTVMQHGLSGVLVDVEAVLSAAAPDLDDDKVTTQAAAASGAELPSH